MMQRSNRPQFSARQDRARTRFRSILRDAGQVPGERELSEQLEPRVMLTQVVSPNGTSIGASAFNLGSNLARNDRVIMDLNPGAAGNFRQDVLSLGLTQSLNGVLSLRLANQASLAAGDTFDIVTSVNNQIVGNFVAIEGLDATAGLDFAAIQGPNKLTIVATTRPTSDFTIVANTQAEADGLVAFYKGLSSSAAATGRIDAPGLEIRGLLTFGQNTPAGMSPEVTISIADGTADADKGRTTFQLAGGFSLMSVFGTSTALPSYTVRDRTLNATTNPNPGLTMTGQFTVSGYSFGGSDTSVTGPTRNASAGPLKFLGLSPTLNNLTFNNQILSADIGFTIASVELKFKPAASGGTETADRPDNPQTTTGDASTEVKAKARPSGSITSLNGFYRARLRHVTPANPFATSFATDAPAVTGGAGAGFSISADSFDLEVPNVLTAHAENITISYNSDSTDGRHQSIVSIGTLAVTLPKLHLMGSFTPTATNPIGLQIFGDGFTFGNFTVVVGTDGTADTTTPPAEMGFLRVSRYLQIRNPSFRMSDLSMIVGANGSVSSLSLGSIAFGLAEIKLGDDATPFHGNATGLNGTDLSVELAFNSNNIPSKFTIHAGSFSATMGIVSLSGTGITLTLPAASDETLLSVGSITAGLSLGGSFFGEPASPPPPTPITFSGTASNFHILGNGHFVADPNFSIGFALNVADIGNLFSRSGASGANKAIPSSATGRNATGDTDAMGNNIGFNAGITLQWSDFNNHAEKFLLTIDAGLSFNISPLSASISVRGLVIDSEKVTAHQFPIIGFESISGHVSGTLAGISFSGDLVVGMLQFDVNGNALEQTLVVGGNTVYDTDGITPVKVPIRLTPANAGLVDHSVLYFGARAAVTLRNGWGVNLMFGFSELGFLQAYVRADLDIAIGGGLSLTSLRGGVTFFANALPAINDPVSLRAPVFSPPLKQDNNQWEYSLRRLVANQAGGHASQIFEVADIPAENWTATLNNQSDPGLFLPQGLRTAFLSKGIVIPNQPKLSSVVALEVGHLWLIKAGSEYLIQKDGSTFSATKVNFSLDHRFLDGTAPSGYALLPSTIGTAPGTILASTIAYTDTTVTPAATRTLADVFRMRRVELSAAATIVKTADGVWQITDGGISYTLTLKGMTASGSTQVLTVEGGEVSRSMAQSAVRMRIDAGFSLSSTGGRNVWHLDADAIVVFRIDGTAAENALSMQFVLIGNLEVGHLNPTTMMFEASLKVEAKAYIYFLPGVMPQDPLQVKIFFLTDMYKFTPPIPNTPITAGDEPAKPFFSLYGDVTLTLPDTANPNRFGIKLAGSRTEGIAVFDAAGLTTPNAGTIVRTLSDQKIVLGKPNSTRSDPGYVNLQFADSTLTLDFDLNLSIEGTISAENIAALTGKFVLKFKTFDIRGNTIPASGTTPAQNTGDDILLPVELYGAATFSASTDNITPLRLAGFSGNFNAKLKINTANGPDGTPEGANGTRTVILDGAGTLQERTITMPRLSFGLFADTQLTFSPPVAGSIYHPVITGAFGIEAGIDTGVSVFIVGSMPLPVPGAQAIGLTADVIGLLKIMPDGHLAARLEIGVQNTGPTTQYFSIGAALQLYVNSTGANVSYRMPHDVAARLGKTLPPSLENRDILLGTGDIVIVVPGSAPLITYSTDSATDPSNPGSAYMVVQGFGHILITGAVNAPPLLDIEGSARIALQISGTATQFKFDVSGNVTLGPIAGLRVQAGIILGVTYAAPNFKFNFAGLLEITAQADTGSLISFVGVGSVRINTFDTPQPVGESPSTPAATLPANSISVYLHANLNVGGIFVLDGTFSFISNSEKIEISGSAKMDLYLGADNRLIVTVNAAIYRGSNPGLVINAAVSLDADFLHVFHINGMGRLQLSTRAVPTTFDNAPSGFQLVPARIDASTPYILAALSVDLNFMSLITVHGDIEFRTINDTEFAMHPAWPSSLKRHWEIKGSLSASAGTFLGGGNVHIGNAIQINGMASGQKAVFYDTGEFFADASMHFQVGPDEFNVNADAYFSVSYLRNSAGQKVLALSGGARAGIHVEVETYIFGTWKFDLTAISITFSYDSSSGIVSFTPCVLPDLDGGICFTLSLATPFKLPPGAGVALRPVVVNLAGAAGPTAYTVRPANDGPEGVYDEATSWTGGDLYLNAGDRGAYRNLNPLSIDEEFYIEADGPYDTATGRQNIRITAFGQTQTRANVSSIYALMGNGKDKVYVRENSSMPIRIPITIDGGTNDDIISYKGAGQVTIRGDAGNDRIIAWGAAGSSVDGGADNDIITWLSGTASGLTILGGTGTDQFIATFSTARDRIKLGKIGAEQFRLQRLSESGTILESVSATSGFETLRVLAGRGNDEVQVDDFEALGLTFLLDISRYESGTRPITTPDGTPGTAPAYLSDTDADSVIISGRNVSDIFTLTSPTDSSDLDGDTDSTERNIVVARSILSGSPPVNVALYTLSILNAVPGTGETVRIDALGGNDTIDATGVSASIAALTLTGGADSDTIDGSEFNDTIYGDNTDGTGNGADIIRGRGGDDTIFGGAGGDTIDGGAGNDAIDSGLGDDTVTGGTGTDTYADAGGTNTFVELRNRDLFISDNTFIVGAIAAGSLSGFADQFSVADEVENLGNLFRIARLTGGAGDNTFVVGDVSGAVSVPGNAARPVAQQFSGHITINGLGGSDRYIVTIFGISGALIDITDTGAASDGIDSLRIFGSDLATRTDNMLVRGNFVAALSDSDANGSLDRFDRVNYNTGYTNALEGGLTIRTLNGDDRFFVDATSLPTTIEGGDGRDLFQFGQIFGTDRVAPAVAVGDEIPTLRILLGTPSGGTVEARLSTGPSSALTALGGEGEDTFIVFHTVNAITLRGENGNDTFSVRAFEQIGGGGTTQGNTTVAGGSGNDAVEFVANAPITIEGGDGIDTVRVLGTFRGDQYIVDSDSIAGPGLNITYSTIEILEINAGDGNDEVFIRSTPANLRTIVYGGAGSDHLYVGEVVPGGTATPRSLSGVNGPVFLDGGPGQPGAFGLSTAVILPTETDGALPPGAGGMSDHELPGDVDTIDIVSTDDTANLSGAMGPRLWPDGANMISVITLSGLGMAGDLVQDGQTIPGGISMRNLEVVDARFGSGQETLAVSGVLPRAITLLAGNGGADTFNITAPAAPGAMLVIYGDSRPGQAMSGIAGNDRIDARTSSLAATIDSGPGNDTVLGGLNADRIAGGSGDDVISGGSGDDLIIGDSRFVVDRLTRITTIITSGLVDSDQPGNDTINPGSGFNIVFGDHGLVGKNFAPAGAFGETGTFTSALTVRPTIGGSDTISALASANPAFAGQPAIANGQDLIFGGAGADAITSGDGDDRIVGDHGSAQIGASTTVIPFASLFGPFVQVAPAKLGGGILGGTRRDLIGVVQGGQGPIPDIFITSTDPTAGGNDLIDSGSGDDVVIGGVGSDTIDAGSGNDIVLGDAGRFDPFAALPQRFVSIFFNQAGAGAADHIRAGEGNDIVMGQQGSDVLFGDQGDDDLIGGHNVAGGLDAADSIDGDAGDDVILGDNGTIVRTPGIRSPRLVSPNGATVPGQTTPSAYNANFDPAVTGPAANAPGAVWVRTVAQLDASPSTPATLYGNDQVAGGAGNDLILAGNGNDQVRGDGMIIDGVSPSLSVSKDSTTDGDDYIEGNSGADTLYGDLGQDDIVGGDSSLFGLTSANRADESDTIFGGSGNQAAPTSNGDTSATGAARDADVIAGDNADILRLVNTNGTPLYYNYDAGAPQRIIPRVVRLLDYTADGLPAGDTGAADTIHGESGADTIYGMTGNDTLYGDGQNDDLIGGSGDDWIYGGAGNDGVLGDDGRLLTSRNGTAEPLNGLAAQAQQSASTGDATFTQSVFTTGDLLKTARLQAPESGGADVIFGGLGDDSLHGGGGMDAISGADALAAFASPPAVRPTLVFNESFRRFTLFNPGFALSKLPNFFLNFDAGPVNAHIDDGADNIFGGDGNDWLVGGTNSDRIFGGLGDDVLSGDDQLDTANTLNTIPDINADAAPDILFGGAGLDRLIGNAANDRLIDWNGEFNQYITPFAASFPTLTKSPNNTLVSALRLLGSGSGMDTRLAEPHGELGLLLNTDPLWLDQYGRALI